MGIGDKKFVLMFNTMIGRDQDCSGGVLVQSKKTFTINSINKVIINKYDNFYLYSDTVVYGGEIIFIPKDQWNKIWLSIDVVDIFLGSIYEYEIYMNDCMSHVGRSFKHGEMID